MSSIKIPQLLKLKDYITLIGTSLGIIALICACIGTRAIISLGFFLISISTGTDMIDGYIARKTNTVNELGRELDSLSDSLTFGIAPAVLTYQSFKTDSLFDIILIIGAICFAIGAILRLARFNISEVPGYTGVPTPISALLLTVYFYANYFYAFGILRSTRKFRPCFCHNPVWLPGKKIPHHKAQPRYVPVYPVDVYPFLHSFFQCSRSSNGVSVNCDADHMVHERGR